MVSLTQNFITSDALKDSHSPGLSLTKIQLLLAEKTYEFYHQKQPNNLDQSYKTDIDCWVVLAWKIPSYSIIMIY